MLRLVWRGVRFARGRAVALAAGMLVAAAAFSLLTASVEVNEADVRGVVGANWRGEYDLLVLPRTSAQTIPGKHLVQVNYLSTATSGITMGQYATVAHLPGVQVAAPLEIVGYVLETADIPVLLSPAAVGPDRGCCSSPRGTPPTRGCRPTRPRTTGTCTSPRTA
jgi:putative ABC transport system permease protein